MPEEGGGLAPEWADRSDNVCGVLHGCQDAGPMAERFERLGWRSRSSSWYGYEVGTTWCEVALEPIDEQDVLMNGVVAPSRFDDLAALLTRFGASYTLELYDENDNLLRETQPQARHTLDSHTQRQPPRNGRSWPPALRTARRRREG